MANDFYDESGIPSTGAALTSATVRGEFTSIGAGFDKLPTMTGNGNKVVTVNAAGTALTATAATALSGMVIGTNVQAWDAQLDTLAALTAGKVTLLSDISALAVTDGNIIVGNGTTWVAESGAAARASLDVPSNAEAILDTIIDAAGDLIVGTAADTVGRLPEANWLRRNICDFRLTLTTGVPVTTADVLAAETLYCAPYSGNQIALYDGANWNIRSSAQFSIDVPDVTGVHDVFCYDNAGVPTLEVLAWTNDTTRATALTTQDGVLVKTGAVTRRYLGTFYSTTAGNGQIEDSAAKRNLWNYYNRAVRPMRVLEATASWTYTTATWRQVNAAAGNQLEYTEGVSENPVIACCYGNGSNSGVGVNLSNGVGVDSTSVNSAQELHTQAVQVIGGRIASFGRYQGYPGVGRHLLVALEQSSAAGTSTWIGVSSPIIQSGITGEVRA